MEESLKMIQFVHPNVLGLVGVCIDTGTASFIILPYMANGSLLNWLKKERNRIIPSESSTEEEVAIYYIVCNFYSILLVD